VCEPLPQWATVAAVAYYNLRAEDGTVHRKVHVDRERMARTCCGFRAKRVHRQEGSPAKLGVGVSLCGLFPANDDCPWLPKKLSVEDLEFCSGSGCGRGKVGLALGRRDVQSRFRGWRMVVQRLPCQTKLGSIHDDGVLCDLSRGHGSHWLGGARWEIVDCCHCCCAGWTDYSPL
jgi:hypothetical protein